MDERRSKAQCILLRADHSVNEQPAFPESKEERGRDAAVVQHFNSPLEFLLCFRRFPHRHCSICTPFFRKCPRIFIDWLLFWFLDRFTMCKSQQLIIQCLALAVEALTGLWFTSSIRDQRIRKLFKRDMLGLFNEGSLPKGAEPGRSLWGRQIENTEALTRPASFNKGGGFQQQQSLHTLYRLGGIRAQAN